MISVLYQCMVQYIPLHIIVNSNIQVDYKKWFGANKHSIPCCKMSSPRVVDMLSQHNLNCCKIGCRFGKCINFDFLDNVLCMHPGHNPVVYESCKHNHLQLVKYYNSLFH